jgi:hypothetical protein
MPADLPKATIKRAAQGPFPGIFQTPAEALKINKKQLLTKGK